MSTKYNHFAKDLDAAFKAARDEYVEAYQRFQQAQQAVFEVEDNGEGIDGEIMPHLFRGYFSVSQSAASDRKRNMGIGLSACMSIVQAHGGSMQAENTPHGALLRFSLPLDCTKPDANISQQEVCIHEDSGENTCSGR